MEAVADLAELTTRLRALHKALLEVMHKKHEAEFGLVESEQLLQLLAWHPDFKWLHELSEFMAEVDELRERESLVSEDACMIFAKARQMLGPAKKDTWTFATTYRAMLQTTPDLVMEHAWVKLLLEKH